MKLSQKQKIFLQFFFFFFFFFAFLKFILGFNIFQKKMTFIVDVFPKLRAPKNVVRSMSKNSSLKGPFDRKHGKWVEEHLQSKPQHPYHIY